jgi:hypothetical protein
MRSDGNAGPRQRRGVAGEGDHPAWQVGSEAIDRRLGKPAARAKPLPRSAGVRSRIRTDRGLRRPSGREGGRRETWHEGDTHHVRANRRVRRVSMAWRRTFPRHRRVPDPWGLNRRFTEFLLSLFPFLTLSYFLFFLFSFLLVTLCLASPMRQNSEERGLVA